MEEGFSVLLYRSTVVVRKDNSCFSNSEFPSGQHSQLYTTQWQGCEWEWKHTRPCATCFQLQRLNLGQNLVVFSVEMNPAIVSQHCQVGPRAHFKKWKVWEMRGGCSVVWRHNTAILWSAEVQHPSFCFFHCWLFFSWMKDCADRSTCMCSRDMCEWIKKWEKQGRQTGVWLYTHTQTHTNCQVLDLVLWFQTNECMVKLSQLLHEGHVSLILSKEDSNFASVIVYLYICL